MHRSRASASSWTVIRSVAGASSVPNGSGLELWGCNGGDNQQWQAGPGVRA